MGETRRTRQFLALAGLALLVTACDDGDIEPSAVPAADPETATEGIATIPTPAVVPVTIGSAAPSGEASTTASPTTTAATSGSTTTSGGADGAAMTITIDIDPGAVWDDGSRITVADFECTYLANLYTPGSIHPEGYDQITSIGAGASDREVVVEFGTVYAPYKDLFRNLLKADAVADCEDVSAAWAEELPFSAQPYRIETWSPGLSVLVANENYHGDDVPRTRRIVMVHEPDRQRQVAWLLSGEGDYIYPRGFPGIMAALDAPGISVAPGFGTQYEVLHFQQLEGPLADDAFRSAFAKSFDRDLVLQNIYEPIIPGARLLNCGPWGASVGPWCDDTAFGAPDGTDGYFDPVGASEILLGAGWVRNDDGLWAKDGVVPTLRWLVDSGNARREAMQGLMIPQLRAAGFDVVPDNCDADCMFLQRLPTMDYDLTMYIDAATPDPSITLKSHCEQIPGAANSFRGENIDGWCNEAASDLMIAADQSSDATARAAQVSQIAHMMADDAVLLPLFQFPNVAAWRADRVGGPVSQDAGNYQAFQNIWAWEDIDGDGQIVVGAEEWPACLNPVTDCASSSWMSWTTAFKVLPSVWDTTAAGTYVPSELVRGEPVVVVAG